MSISKTLFGILKLIVEGEDLENAKSSRWQFVDEDHRLSNESTFVSSAPEADLPDDAEVPQSDNFPSHQDEDEIQNSNDTEITVKKSKKKRPKKKKRSNSVTTTSKSVTWGNVEEILFSRALVS
jgi:hypothetical protein